MLQYNYSEVSCPKCRRKLIIKITAIMRVIRVTSGLGPNFIICSSCKTKMMTYYKEWQQMSSEEKIWFFLLSIFYGCILGFMTSIPLETIFEISPQYTIPIVLLIILSLQELRILMSIDRTEKNKSEKTIIFWTWDTNLHFYGMAWVLLTVIIDLLLSIIK
jgi:hypothetical protein